ncbi:hypothetical protein [Nocardioides jensenii]|uniref:hypothetical protein n=1 Tax=Nocardioides jensenii TaxID=1843 RepID=UPI00082E4245|nr:hypothetical protein [Nocardioides jensenii]
MSLDLNTWVSVVTMLGVGLALWRHTSSTGRGFREDLKSDIAELRAELTGDNAALRAELKGDNAALSATVADNHEKAMATALAVRDELRSDLGSQIQDVRVEFRGRMDDLRGDVGGLRSEVSKLESRFYALVTHANPEPR